MKKFALKNYYILLPICITLFMMLTCHLYYAAIDDVYMMEIASSNFRGSENLVCMNVLYGYLFKALYTIVPGINWFAVVYLVLLNIAMIMLFKLVKDEGSPIFAVGILAIIETYILIRITFTALAFISCTAAVMWVMNKVKRLDKKSIVYFAESFIMFVAGLAMRGGSVFYCIFFLFIPLYAFAVIEKRVTVGVIITLLVLFATANYGTQFVQKSYNKNIPDETYFNQFQKYRAKVTDIGYVDYDAHVEQFQRLGISENDILMARGFMYADKSVFTENMMKNIHESKSNEEKYTFNFVDMLKKAIRLVFIWWYILVAILALVMLKDKHSEVMAVSLFVLGAIAYLLLRQRAVPRVVNQISIAGIIMLMFIGVRTLKGQYSFSELKKNKLIVLIITAFLGFNIAVAWGYHIMTAEELLQNAAPLTEYINANPENKYLCHLSDRAGFINRELTFSVKSTEHKPVYDINGDWYVYTAYWYGTLDKLGLSQYADNSFNALLDPDVRYINSREDRLSLITTFLHEHYQIESEFELEKEFAGSTMKIYRLVEKN